MNDINEKWSLYFFSKMKKYEISKNPNIILNTVIKNTNYHWNLEDLCYNPSFTLEFFYNSRESIANNIYLKYMYVNWNDCYYYLNYNPSIKDEDVDKYLKFNYISYVELSCKKNITINFILNNLNKQQNWKFDIISKYKYDDITIEILNKYPNLKWDFSYISRSKHITIDIINANPNLNWSIKDFSKNPNINIDILNKYYKIFDFDWYYISKNKKITWNDILNNLHLPWNHDGISGNPNITWNIIIENNNIKWNYNELSLNPNIDWLIINDNQNKSWNYTILTCNYNITWDIIKKNQDKPWNYINFILHNPNVTIDSFISIYDMYKDNDKIINIFTKKLNILEFNIDKELYINNFNCKF